MGESLRRQRKQVRAVTGHPVNNKIDSWRDERDQATVNRRAQKARKRRNRQQELHAAALRREFFRWGRAIKIPQIKRVKRNFLAPSTFGVVIDTTGGGMVSDKDGVGEYVGATHDVYLLDDGRVGMTSPSCPTGMMKQGGLSAHENLIALIRKVEKIYSVGFPRQDLL